MRIEETYYGDFRVFDEMPFDLNALSRAEHKIAHSFDAEVGNWPITIDHNERTGYWEVWFTRPVSDEDYINRIGLASD